MEWTKIFISRFALPRTILTHPLFLIIVNEEIWSPWNITFIHFIRDIMLIGQDKQEVANMLEALDPTSESPHFFKANSLICLLRNLVLLIILSLSYIFNSFLSNISVNF